MNPNHSTKMKKSMIIHGAAAAIALLTMATPAGAVPVPIPIANAGFENPVLATDGAYTASIVGWTTINNGDIGAWNVKTTHYPAQAPEGFNVAFIYNNAASVTGFSQVLSGATGQLQADASYTLTVKVGDSLSYTYPGYKIQLLANGTVLAEDDDTLAPITNGTFATTTLNYTYNAGLHAALVGEPLEIRLLCKGLVVGGEVEFDNVQLSVTLANPVAAPGGPYPVLSIGSLSLNGITSQPSDGQTIANPAGYEWDLDNDGDYDESITGSTPAAIPYATLTAAPPTGYGMSEGANTIKLRVTDSAAKTSTASTTVTLAVASSDADLFNLVTTPDTLLTPSFDSSILSYTASVPYATASMTVTPTKWDPGATIGISLDNVTYIPINSGSASALIPLDVGIAKVIYLKVTAEDTTTTQTYTLTVTRAAPSTNADLADLTTTPATTFDTTFAPGTITYATTVDNATSSITVTPTKADSGASIKVNNTTVTSGNSSPSILLSVGANIITTVVTAEDTTTTKTYTLTVTRDPDTTPPTIASLSPADDTAAASNSNLAVTFDEPIAVGTGYITIKNLTDGPPDVTIAITDATQVSVAGAVLTINPTADLVVGKSYAIRIDATAIKDTSGNFFLGIADDTTWNFTATLPSYTWTQTAGNAQAWTTGTNWLGGVVPNPATGVTMDFSTVNIAANTTLTLGADRTAEIWKFGDISGAQTWTVNIGNQMILAGTTPTINVLNNTATLNNVVAGTQGLTKTGSGKLTLTGTNTFTGGLVINAGNVTIGSIDSLGAANGTVTVNTGTTLTTANAIMTLQKSFVLNNNALLSFSNGSSPITITGAVTGTGGIAPQGAGSLEQRTLTLQSTANTFAGPIVLGWTAQNLGTISVVSLLDDATHTGAITFGTGTSGSSGEFIWGAGGGSALTLNNRQILFTGPFESTGVIKNNNTTNAITINTALAVDGVGSKTLQLDGVAGPTNVFAGVIGNGSGTVSLTKAGAGTWSLSNTGNSYSGGTNVSAGTLKANGAGALGTGNVTVTAGTLQIDAADAMADTATLRLPSATTKNLTMNANDTVAKLFIAGVPQPNGSYSAATNASAWMNGTGILTVGLAAAQPVYWDLDGATAGAGGATPAGTWDGTNTYWNNSAGTGTAATWSAGATAAFAAGTDATGIYTVTVDGTQDIGGLTFEEGTVTLSGGTALRLVSDSVAFVNTGLTATIATPLTQDATARGLTKGGTGTLVLASGSNTFTGPTTVGAGTLRLTDTNTSALATSALVLNTGGTLGLRGNGAASFTTPVPGAGVSTVVPGATVSIDVNNNGSGSGNTLTMSGGIRLVTPTASSTINVTGGNGYVLNVPTLTYDQTGASSTLTLNPTSASMTIGTLAHTWVGSSAKLTLDGTSTGNSILSTPLSDFANGPNTWLGIDKSNTSTWTVNLTGSQPTRVYLLPGNSGNLIVNGTIKTKSQNASSGVRVEGGVLHYNNAGAVDTSAGLNAALRLVNGSLDNSSGAPITTSTYNPIMEWNGNWTFVGSNGANSDLYLGTGAVTMGATRTVTIQNAAATLSVGGVISGAGGLTKAGPGTLKLSGANTNTYAGLTTISGGTLALGANNVLPATAVSIGSGTLNAATFTDTVGSLDVTNTAAVINLGSGGTLAFADSSAVSWTDVVGNLNITGTFVSGSSLRFGTSSSGLTSTQLSQITASGYGSFALNASGYLTATAGSGDVTPPTLASSDIVDDKSGGPIAVNTLVTYTVTFSEDMDAATVTAADFGNAGSSAVTIGSVTETTPTSGVFTVQATPTTTGTLQLKVNAGAVLNDVAGNPLNTASAIADNTTITVQSVYNSWSGGAAFGIDSNNDGVKNGLAWVLGANDKDVNAISLLPTFDNTSDPLYFIYTYRRSDSAAANSTIAVEYGSTLSGWTSAVHDGTNIIISTSDNFYSASPGVDKVEVKIKKTLAVGDKLFARLNVLVP